MLRKLRLKAGLSLRTLAAKSGLHWMTIWKIESGLASPKLETLKAIASALKVKVSRLLNGNNT